MAILPEIARRLARLLVGTREQPPTMRRTRLGTSSTTLSIVGLGCDKMYPGAREAEFAANIAYALDSGVTVFDTAAIYGNGSNEEFLGRALRGRRHQAFICTKFGHLVQADGRPGGGGRPEHVAVSCEQSLRRLGTDVIDLFCQHLYDPITPVEDTVGALARLVEQGKIRHLGLSNVPPENVRRAHAVHPIAAVQSEYSLWLRQAEAELLPTCKELGITFLAYWPLAQGLLAGRIKTALDLEKDEHRALTIRGNVSGLSLASDLRRLAAVDAIAKQRGCTPAQIALAWILAGDYGVVPIPGTKDRAHLAENIAAANIRLTADEISALNAALPGPR